MNSITHILSPYSAPWCAWTMLGLLVCAIVSELIQPGIITQAGVSLHTRADRTYKEAPNNFLGKFFVSVFRVGISAMAVYMFLSNNRPFTIKVFGIICAIILSVILIKKLCNTLLDYTFQLSRRFASVYDHYSNIYTIAAIVLYPFLLVLIYIGHAQLTQWVIGIICLLFVITWTIRGARIFIVSPKAILYFMIYICTLELIPLGMIFYLSEQTILL